MSDDHKVLPKGKLEQICMDTLLLDIREVLQFNITGSKGDMYSMHYLSQENNIYREGGRLLDNPELTSCLFQMYLLHLGKENGM